MYSNVGHDSTQKGTVKPYVSDVYNINSVALETYISYAINEWLNESLRSDRFFLWESSFVCRVSDLDQLHQAHTTSDALNEDLNATVITVKRPTLQVADISIINVIFIHLEDTNFN